MSRYELADAPKIRKTISAKNIKYIKVIATILPYTYSGAYSFSFTGSSVTFVLEITKLPVHLWQEQ